MATTDLSSLTFCVVDVETSGLRPERDRLLQIGTVLVDGNGTILREWETLLRPTRRWLFRLGPRRIHHIRRRDLRQAPPREHAIRQFREQIGGAMLVAHNATFDVAFLQQEMAAEQPGLELEGTLCTLRLSRLLDPERQRSHRLGDLCQRYNVSLERPHDALEDARATAEILAHLLREHQVASVDDVRTLVSRSWLRSEREVSSPAVPPD